MNDNNIIKALECCPLDDIGGCRKKDALDLINRQKAEIERLHEVINGFEEQSHKELLKFAALSEKYTDAKAEIENLTAMLERSQKKYELAIDALIRAKTKDIKEFAERLKQSAFDCDVSFGYGKEHYTEAVAVVEIDNLVKEMVGE